MKRLRISLSVVAPMVATSLSIFLLAGCSDLNFAEPKQAPATLNGVSKVKPPTTVYKLPAYLPKQGLVGWWPFNGNAKDESGNGNDGVVNGAVLTKDRFGKSNNAFRFNGVDNNIIVASSPSINIAGNTLSITTWIFYEANQLQINQKGISKGGYDSGNGYELVFSDDGGTPYISFYGADGGNYAPITSNFFETWHFVVSVYTDGFINIFLDGTPITSYSAGSIGTLILPNNNPLYFGTRAPTNANIGWLKGTLDDIAIYNRALTASEITKIYKGK